MSSPLITVTAWDLCTNVLLTNLQAINPTYTERLNDAGPFSFDLDLTDQTTSAQTAVILGLAGNPFKVIFSDPNQNIQFTGIARTGTMNPSSPVLSVTGTMLTGYLASVFAAKSYITAISPANLMVAAVNDVQAQRGANVWITPNLRLTNPPAPFTPAYQVGQRIKVSQILSDLTMGITPGAGGVDYYMASTFQSGTPLHLLNICAPRCGQDRTASGWSVDLSRAITWSWSVDNSSTSNQAIVVGSGTGASQPLAVGTAPYLIGGLGQPPLMQGLYQFNRVVSQAQLQSIANGAAQMFGGPVGVFTVTLPVDYDGCPLGGFGIGDDVLVASPKSPWFPAGLYQWWRIVAYQVTYPTEGVPTVQLTLNIPPVF
jgi:hypothetical protein